MTSRDATLGEVNQCDGCQRGLPTRMSKHGTLMHDGDDGMPVMACTADRYRTRSAIVPIDEAMRQLTRALHEQCFDTALFTREQWNEEIAPKLSALSVSVESLKSDVNTLNEVLRLAGWGQGEIDATAAEVQERLESVPSQSAPIEQIVAEVVAADKVSAAEYRGGNEKAFNTLVKQAMRATGGKANPAEVNEALRRQLAPSSIAPRYEDVADPDGPYAAEARRLNLLERLQRLAQKMFDCGDDPACQTIREAARQLSFARSAIAPRDDGQDITRLEIQDDKADNLGVDRFATAMRSKLEEKRLEGYYGWNYDCSIEHLEKLLEKHIDKPWDARNLVDVANFCMMLWNREHPKGVPNATDRTAKT